MAPDSPSSLRVFIHWHDQTVFAGEDVKCTITFKNVASRSSQQKQHQSQPSSQSDRTGKRLPSRGKASAGLAPPLSTTGRGHKRSALSLSVPSSASRGRSESFQWPSASTVPIQDGKSGHGHTRSISIVSIGSTSTIDDSHQRHDALARSIQRPAGHSRAASLQMIPGRPGGLPSPRPGHSRRETSSPMINASYPPDRFGRIGGLTTEPNSPNTYLPRRSPRASPRAMPEFRFPAAPPPATDVGASTDRMDESLLSPTVGVLDRAGTLTRSKDLTPERPATRILANSNLSGGGTPRSSSEFYTVSNHSSETLASEYPGQMTKGHIRPPHLRRSSGLSALQEKPPESVMMGYAQIQGSFVLDGSLVSLSPFEQVKKSSVVGGRGGGVVGLDSGKRDSGFMKGFGWGNISTSLNDFLGGSELSTIKEMRGVANSRSVPLLSTPQSILFVDLQLAPGESRSYEYTFTLPKGLPPTHKGKAVKISYSLVIGTQRPGGAKEQQVRSVEVPFKVLGSVNSTGEILGHDLMNPYVLLRDEAQVRSTGKGHRSKKERQSVSTMNEFLSYVDDLATRPRDETNGTLLSPTDHPASRRQSAVDQASTAKEAIRLAIMKSNIAGEGQQAPNRFEIARNGQRVGVIMLTRPAFRLGEVITMAIDFSEADVPCFAVHSSLETTEKIDPALALRSESSIHRVTRKVYASTSEAALYSRRVVFTPTIPITATPEFMTSGISLEWKIRVEFVVPASIGEDDGSEEPQLAPQTTHPLLEKIAQDEKGGLVLAAVENLACESFDISVPLKVYGAVGTGLERLEKDEALEEGLAI